MRRLPAVLAVAMLVLGLASAPRLLTSNPKASRTSSTSRAATSIPLALTPDGDRLLVVNTPDNRLAVFDLTGGVAGARSPRSRSGSSRSRSRRASDGEAWVVNHALRRRQHRRPRRRCTCARRCGSATSRTTSCSRARRARAYVERVAGGRGQGLRPGERWRRAARRSRSTAACRARWPRNADGSRGLRRGVPRRQPHLGAVVPRRSATRCRRRNPPMNAGLPPAPRCRADRAAAGRRLARRVRASCWNCRRSRTTRPTSTSSRSATGDHAHRAARVRRHRHHQLRIAVSPTRRAPSR